jgi:hypothetical protein
MSLQKPQSKLKDFQKKLEITSIMQSIKLLHILHNLHLNYAKFLILALLDSGSKSMKISFICETLHHVTSRSVYNYIYELQRMNLVVIKYNDIEINYNGRLYIDKIYNMLFVS